MVDVPGNEGDECQVRRHRAAHFGKSFLDAGTVEMRDRFVSQLSFVIILNKFQLLVFRSKVPL